MTVLEFARIYLNPYTVKSSEIIPTYCPLCHGGKRKDKHTFALNIDKKTYNCKRGSCGAQGHFVELCKIFGVEPEHSPKREYKRPEKKPQKASDPITNYLKLRGISKQTAEKYRIGSDEDGNIQFPYFNENNEHVFNKFRVPRKIEKGERKMWRESDTMPILFGMHLCDKSKPLCIFEGEMDAMVGYESGIPNCVSVPSGAEDFTWLDTCWDFVQQFESVYIYGDNDAPGREMTARLVSKLSDKRVFIVSYDGKDANELLYRQGKEAVKNAWQNAKEVPVAGLINLADVIPYDATTERKVRCGISKLNTVIGGFYDGDVSVWTGKRGDGKSTMLSQMLIDAVEDGAKVCAYSGELRADRFQYWVDLQAAGKANVSEYYDNIDNRSVYYVKEPVRDRIHRWYDGRFWLYDNAVTLTDESATILKVFETAAKRYDCRVFLADNLMTAVQDDSGDKDYYRQQSNFVKQLVRFANLYGVHVHLAAHPNKTRGKLENDSISGSGDITNLAANVFSVTRVSEDDESGLDLKLEVLKNRWNGTHGAIGMKYDPVSRRVYTQQDGNGRRYGWEFEGTQGEEPETERLPWDE